MSTEITTSEPLSAYQERERMKSGEPTPARLAQCRLHREFSATVQGAESWRNNEGWSLGLRTCHDTFLLIPMEGSLLLELGDSSRRVIAPGGFILLPPNEPHALALCEGESTLAQIAVHLDLKDRYGRSWMAGVKARSGRLPGNAETWWDAFRELVQAMEIDREAGLQLGATTCLHLLSRLTATGEEDWLPERNLEEIDPRIAGALEHIRSDPPGSWTVDALADSQRLTAVQFRKLFKRATGQSPKRYMLDRQLEQAVKLLRTTTLEVQEIAAKCGFVHAHHFHTVFRQRTGQTASTYRRMPSV